MNLPPGLLSEAAAKAAKALEEVALDELPALTYQLLLLGSQQGGQERRRLLRAMLALFNQLDVEAQSGSGRSGGVSVEALRGLKGNVISFFTFAASADHGLGLSLLQIIRGEDKEALDGSCRWLSITPFSAALTLSIMQVTNSNTLFDVLAFFNAFMLV